MAILGLQEHMDQAQPTDVVDQTLGSMMPVPENTQSLAQKFSDQWGINTSVGSLITNGLQDSVITDPSFNPALAIKGTPYEQFGDEAIYADNKEELEAWKLQKSKELEIQSHIATAGWGGIVGMVAAQVTDPINLIPWLGQASKVKKGMDLIKYAGMGAGMGASTMAAQEGVLQATQTGRSAEQTIFSVGAGAVLGGVVGGAIGGTVLGRQAVATKVVEQILKDGDAPKIRITPGKDSASAARVEAVFDDAHIAKIPDWAVKALQVPGLRAPILEGLTADSRVLNSISSSMFEHSNLEMRNLVEKPHGVLLQDAKDSVGPYANISDAQLLNKDAASGKATVQVTYKNPDSLEPIVKDVSVDMHRPGSATPEAVDTLIKHDREKVYQLQNDLKKIYLNYTNTKAGLLEEARAKLNTLGTDKLSFKEMLEESAKTLRRGDVHENPHVTKMAETLRKQIEAANVQMTKSEVPLPEFDLKGRESYYPIIHDKQAILNDRAGFEKVIRDHYIGSGVDAAEAKSIAIEYADNALGAGEDAALLSDISRMSLDKGVTFTKERVSDVPDTLLEPWLVNDPLRTVSAYVTQASQLSRFYDMLHLHGVNSMTELKRLLHAEYLEKETLAGSNAELRASLSKEYVKNQNLLQDFAAITLGQYSKRSGADSALRALRTYNYLRLMGYIVLSSITDIAMPVFKHGLGRTFMDGYVKGISSIVKGLRPLEVDMMNHIGVAIDQEMDGGLRTLIDPDFGSSSIRRVPKIGTGLGPSTKKLYNDVIYGISVAGDSASYLFNRATGMQYWNRFHKRLAARIAISRVMKDLSSYDTLASHEKEYLNSIGIGSTDVSRIVEQFNKYGGKAEGGYISDVREWSDSAAADKFSAAILKEVDSTIVTPGRGDTPRWIQKTELARTLTQFKGFFSAMTTKALVTGVQRRDKEVMQGVAALLTLGALQYVIRMQMQGKKPNTDADNLLLEAVNRSGMLGLLGDPVFGIVLSNRLGGGSRYLNQGWMEYLLGPSASLLKSGNKIAESIKHGNADDKTLKQAETLLPFQNLFWLRLLMDKVNKGDH